jgi:hypothetical protein
MSKLDRKAVSQLLNTARLTAAATLKSIKTNAAIYHGNGTLDDEQMRQIEKITYEAETETRNSLSEISALIEVGAEPLEICKTKIQKMRAEFDARVMFIQTQLKAAIGKKERSDESTKMVEWTKSYASVAIDPAGRRFATKEIYEEIEREIETEKARRAMYTAGFPLKEFETKRIATRTITTTRGSLTFKFDPIGGEREPGGALDQLREFFLNEQAILEEQEYISQSGDDRKTYECKFCKSIIGPVVTEDGTQWLMEHSDNCWWDLSKQAFKFLFE